MEKLSDKFFFKLFVIAFYLFVFFILLNQTFSYLDPDFGWHLKFGEEISQSKDVPRLNNVNYILEEIPLLDHEWLSDWAVYEIYNKYGYGVLGIVFSVVMLLIYILQYIFVKRYFLGNSACLWIFFPIQLFAISASHPSLGIRIQVLTLLFSLITLFIIYEYQKSKKKLILFFLPILFWLWASLHGGFVLGLMFLFFFVIIKLIELFWKPDRHLFFISRQVMSFREWLFFASVSLLAFGVTFLTPYRFELYSFLTTYSNDYYLKYIVEWFHQFHFPFVYLQIIFLQFFVLVLIMWSISTFWLKKKEFRPSLWELFLICFLTFFAFKSRRHFLLFAVLVLPIGVAMLNKLTGLGRKNFSFKISKSVFIDVFIKIFIILCFVVAIMSQVIKLEIINNPWTKFSNKYPAVAVEFFNNNPELHGKRMLNTYNWGGYFIWVLPEEKLFIDGRLPQYPYDGVSMLEEYGKFFAEGRQEEMLEKHNIELIFKQKHKPLEIKWWEEKFFGVKINDSGENNENIPMDDYLKNSTEWENIYRDDVAEIFIKK